MDTAEKYILVTVTLLFLAGLGWLGMAVRNFKRTSRQWSARADNSGQR